MLSLVAQAVGTESVPLGLAVRVNSPRTSTASQTQLCKYGIFQFTSSLKKKKKKKKGAREKCREFHFSLRQISTFLFLHFFPMNWKLGKNLLCTKTKRFI